MKIIVMIKQVPNTTKVKIDQNTGNIIREGIESIVNPDDLRAIEASLILKERYGGKIFAISMGPPQAFDSLIEAIGMGIDDSILLSDKAFSGADTWATSHVLSKAIEKIGDYDLILCGRQAIDGDTSQVGPQVAASLKIPQVTSVFEIQKVCNNKLSVKCNTEEGYNVVQVRFPVLLSVSKKINKPRYPNIVSMIFAHTKKTRIKTWDSSDIGTKISEVGKSGSFTEVIKTYSPNFKRENKILEGDLYSILEILSEKIKKSM